MRFARLPLCMALCVFSSTAFAASEVVSVPAALLLPPGEDNPRNSEGDFIQLANGHILYVYTHFTDGAGDHATAYLASRFSIDGGKSWSGEDQAVLTNEGGYNIMSVSLLRLADNRIAMLYLRKNSTDDCVPLIRFSSDETASWSDPVVCITDPVGYYVVNNDRMIQLDSGRLLIPASRHALKGGEFQNRGIAMCVLSDDNGQTWRLSQSRLEAPESVGSGLQEPGVVALKDGRLLMLARTSDGAQYRSFSSDDGNTWSTAEATGLRAPVSPATVERIPGTGDLLLVWNDHTDVQENRAGKRTPLTAALSQDEGNSWRVVKTLEDLEHGWYCYTAMAFTKDAVLLGYCAGDRSTGNGLETTKLTRIPLQDLYDGLSSARTILAGR